MIRDLTALLPLMEAGAPVSEYDWRAVAISAEYLQGQGDPLADAILDVVGYQTVYHELDGPAPGLLTFRADSAAVLRRLLNGAATVTPA